MVKAEKLIVKHFDIWTSSIKSRSSSGRGLNKKKDLYGIQKLRELIIQMALVGKLVPQDPEDVHAASSLEKARNKLREAVSKELIKKQQLPKENKKITFKKPLPKGWAYATLPEVVQPEPYSIKRGPFGSSIKKDMFVPDGYKVYEQQHAIYDDFDLGEYYLSEKDFNRLKAFEIKPFDVIISCSGTVGRVSIAPEKLKPGVINQALLKISLNQDVLLNEYFKILFPNYFMTLEKLSDLKGTAQKNMPGMPVMKILPFPLPPIAEQRRIVSKVKKLMGICDQMKKNQECNIETHNKLVTSLLNALTSSTACPIQFADFWKIIQENFDTLFITERSVDQLEQTILKLAVMGKLIPQDPNDEPAEDLFAKIIEKKETLIEKGLLKKQKELPTLLEKEKPFQIPENWKWVRLNDVFDIRDGTHDSPKDAIGDDTFPLITSKDFKEGKIDFKGARRISRKDHIKISERSCVQVNDILFSMIGGNIGNQVMVKDPIPFSIKNVALFKYYSQELTPPKFLKIYTEELALDLQQKASGGAQPFISLGALRNLPIALPPTAEQHRIVCKVDEIIKLCKQLKMRITAAQTTKINLVDSLVRQTIR